MHVLESVFIAVDGRYSMPKFESPNLNINARAKSWNVGPVVGVSLPFLFSVRAWGGWVAAGGMDPKESNGYDFKFTSGNGYRIGAGIGLGPVGLNIEYQDITYDKATIQSQPANSNWNGLNLENKSYVLSVSMPLKL
ncbi:MAG: hypothetical protein ACOYL6_16270 [Bacteriovoracaceae bacterium]